MKIIIAKQSGLDRVAYINANNINSFHADINQYDQRPETKIYFTGGKCEIEGNRANEIGEFMSEEGNCGILDLTKEYKKSVLERIGHGTK